MRILIVEDEPKTREGLINTINKFTEYEVCGVASNGFEGRRLFKELSPDLIISDIQMPEMDGLTMLRELEQEGDVYYALILSGYSSFEYVRTALHLGVVDYILKPLDVESFITTLQAIDEKLTKTMTEKTSTEQLVWSLLTCEPNLKEQLRIQLLKQLLVNDRMEITLFLIKPDNLDQETVSDMLHCLKDRMKALCDLKFKVLPLSFFDTILVLIIDTERHKLLDKLFSTYILPALHEIGGCVCSYTTIIGLINLEKAVKELKELQSYRFVYGSEVLLNKPLVDKIKFCQITYPFDLENRIKKELINGDYEKALKTSNKFKELIIESEGRPELIKEYTARFSSSIYSIVKEYNTTPEPLLIFHYFINNIIDSKTKKDLIQNYEKIVHTILEGKDEELDIDNQIIMKVIQYIRINYYKNITLSDAADLVGLTPEYLSKLFYQKINVNFVVFLRNFRISVAKRMILSGKYRIQDVADQVGFKDPKYFNKVFKSVCGISPSEYKKVI